MRDGIRNIILILQLAYFLMLGANGVGKINIITDNLGYVVWGFFAFLSLILSIFAYYKVRSKAIIIVCAISALEIGLTVFIYILPSLMGIPF